jgi:hypothetical protein
MHEALALRERHSPGSAAGGATPAAAHAETYGLAARTAWHGLACLPCFNKHFARLAWATDGDRITFRKHAATPF